MTSSMNINSYSGNESRNSLMKIALLKPEYEFKLMKLIILRENYLRRLINYLKSSNGKVNIEVVGVCDILREVTIETVETLILWERAQVYMHSDNKYTVKTFLYLLDQLS